MTVRQLIIGFPKSGKSTFIAALWALLTTPGAPTQLRLGRLDGDRTRLNNLRDRYLRCLPMKRTHASEEGWVEIELLGGPSPTTLSLPDLSGESFESQWRDRTCDKQYSDAASAADGVILCLHSTAVREPTTIASLRALAAELAAVAAQPSSGETVSSAPPENDRGGTADGLAETTEPGVDVDVAEPHRDGATRPWNPDRSPTQVQAIEILQFLTTAPLGPRRRRLAVVLSAWDLATAGKSPDEWLADRFPLLEQYLSTNEDLFAVSVFGVSAQGGALTDDGNARLRSSTPDKRIEVHRTGSAKSYDLTTIIRWTLGD